LILGVAQHLGASQAAQNLPGLPVQVLSKFGQALGSPRGLAELGPLHPNGDGALVKQEPEQQWREAAALQLGAAQEPAAGSLQPPGLPGLQLRDPALRPVGGVLGHRRLRDPSIQPVSGTIGHRRGRGSGQPGLTDAESARPRRTVRRPARRFDDDFEAPEPDSDEVGAVAEMRALCNACTATPTLFQGFTKNHEERALTQPMLSAG
jgi:hypothetical protein